MVPLCGIAGGRRLRHELGDRFSSDRFDIFHTMPRHLTLWLLVVAAAACGSDARVSAPAEASAFARFVAVGTGLSMGEQSGGVVYESQIAAWPAQLAARVDAPFRVRCRPTSSPWLAPRRGTRCTRRRARS